MSKKDGAMLRVTEYLAKSLKVTKNGTIRKLGYSLLFAFHSILYHFRDKARARCWPKSANLSPPPAFDALLEGGVPIGILYTTLFTITW